MLWKVLCISKDRVQGGKGKDKECFRIIKGKFPYILHPGENSITSKLVEKNYRRSKNNPRAQQSKMYFLRGKTPPLLMCCYTPSSQHSNYTNCFQHSVAPSRARLTSAEPPSQDRQINASTNWANSKWSDRKAPYCLLTVGADVSLFAPDDFHQAVQGAAFAMQAGAVVLDLPSAAQDDFWAQREVFHQHAPVIQHFTLALTAHLSTWAKRRWCDLVSMLSRALLDLCYQCVGRVGTMSTLWTAPD